MRGGQGGALPASNAVEARVDFLPQTVGNLAGGGIFAVSTAKKGLDSGFFPCKIPISLSPNEPETPESATETRLVVGKMFGESTGRRIRA